MIILIWFVSSAGEWSLKRKVEKAEDYISEGKYELALNEAYSMDENYDDSWSETRLNLIDRILDLQAKKNINKNKRNEKVYFPTDDLIGKQVNDVISILSLAGFTNIRREPVKVGKLKGLFNKLVKKKGQVDEISINGSTDFESGEAIDSDARIVVRYLR